MSTLARVAALVAAGVTFCSLTARGADRAAYWPSGDGQNVQQVSAVDDAYYADSNTATYPPKKKKAKPADADTNADPTLKPSEKKTGVRRASAQQPTPAEPRGRRVTQASARLAEGDPVPAGKAPSTPAPMPPMASGGAEGKELVEGPLGGPAGGCDTCDSCGCNECFKCIHWCGGVDYLLLKPRFSNDTALTTATATTAPGVGNANGAVTTATNTVDFGYDYNSQVHAFVGIASDCGGLRFGYWRFQDAANESATATGNFTGGAGTAVQGIATSQIITDGSVLNATTHTHVDLYDIDRLQHLNLPSCCADWDVNWLYGVRIGHFHRTIDEFDPIETVNLGSEFTGAGPRIGIEAHRNMWSCFSTFVSADASLLVGTFKGSFNRVTPGLLQDTIETTGTNQERVVPTFGLQIGFGWNPTCNTSVTAGYMVEAFSDAVGNNGALGCTNCGNTGTTPGTGNILSFDGIFVRMQHCF